MQSTENRGADFVPIFSIFILIDKLYLMPPGLFKRERRIERPNKLPLPAMTSNRESFAGWPRTYLRSIDDGSPVELLTQKLKSSKKDTSTSFPARKKHHALISSAGPI